MRDILFLETVMNGLLETAIQAALKAGEKISEIYHDPKADFEVELKADHSPLTIADNQMILTKSDGANVPSWVDFPVGEEVSLCAVQGRVIYRDGEFANVDYREYFAEVNRHTDAIGDRAKKEFDEIDGTNSRFMKEGKL